MQASDSLIQRLLDHAALHPEREALTSSAVSLSYSQLADLVRAQARSLRDAGITDSSVAGLCCAADIQHLVLCLAIIHIGATSCTIPSNEDKTAQTAIARMCGVSHVVDASSAIDPVAFVNGEAHESSVAPASSATLLFSTSGTTGDPKLVIHHDTDLVAQAHRHINSIQERFACLASIEQNFVKRHRLYCIAEGATNVFLDAGHDALVTQCLALDVNVLHLSAFQAREVLAVPGVSQLAGIRLKLGGSLVPLALREQLRSSVTHKLQAGYGTTETGAIGFTDIDDLDASESVGQALPGIEVRVVSPNRKPVAAGERGELAIRCAGMFRGYLGKPELTAERLQDGWFYTGDLGFLDDSERIHLCGRADDMFVFNSMNIYPQDIESQICEFPGVKDAAVLPEPSAVHGNIPIALVVFADESSPDIAGLSTFMRKRAGARSPRKFESVTDIPRNATGKIIRRTSVNLLTTGENIRKDIIDTLAAGRSTPMRPALIAAFISGDKDIALRDLGLDSLGRMNLMVLLEVDYDVVVTPEEFARFRTLDDITARALSASAVSPQQKRKDDQHTRGSGVVSDADGDPYVLRFFRRVLHYCPTAAQLHKALATLEHRLTPLDLHCLHDAYRENRVISQAAAEKFHEVLSRWFDELNRMLQDSGKAQPEAFVANRIAPTVIHFTGPGEPADKTLLICFPGSGSRQLLMPNAVLLQHTVAERYDALVLSEPLREGYRRGVPLLGDNIREVVEWLGKLELINKYKTLRTVGCSAGGHAAVIAAYRLHAELGVSVGGRFHSERYPHRILGRIIATWRGVRDGSCPHILASYAVDKTRDRHFALVMRWLTGANLLAVEFADEPVGHLILQRLTERSELATYLARTVFASLDEDWIATPRSRKIMKLPGGELHAANSGIG